MTETPPAEIAPPLLAPVPIRYADAPYPRPKPRGRAPLPVGTHGNVRCYQRPNGSWRAQTTYRDLDGATRYVERHGPTKNKARTALLDALKHRRRAQPGAVAITADTLLAELAEAWYSTKVAEGKLAYRSLESYRSKLDNYVIPLLGRLRTHEATVQILDTTIQRIKDQVGASVAKTTRTCLSGMLGLAARYGALDRNPARDIAAIELNQPATQALTLEQAMDLRRRIHANDRARARDLLVFTDMMVATGERIGETLAIQWNCLDLDPTTLTGSVEIRGTVIRKKKIGLVIEPTKSQAGNRIHELPSWMVTVLIERRDQRQPAGNDPVFPNLANRKTLRDPSNVTAHLRQLFDDCGYHEFSSHGWRKIVATAMDEDGLSARLVADQLGQADITTTQRHYLGRSKKASHAARVLAPLGKLHL